MLKDRRVLLENEITKQRALCGRLYIQVIRSTESTSHRYDAELEKLTVMSTELTVICHMIAEGHE